MDKAAEAFEVRYRDMQPGEKFINSVIGGGIPSSLLTGGINLAINPRNPRAAARSAGYMLPVGTGLSYLLQGDKKLERV